jgi:hypothetical protein
VAETVPPNLLAVVSRDLRPLAPLAAPSRRTLWLVPIALVLLCAAVLVFGLRRDAPILGFKLTWVASVLQMLLGLALTTAALRESVPGTTLSRRAVGLAFGTTIVAVITITWMTWLASPPMITPRFMGYIWRVCVAGTVVSALPALAVSGWLAARAFPLRPRLAGALYGLGAGLMADAGWRLFCHFSNPAHVFNAHLLSVAACGLIGAIGASPHIFRGTFQPAAQSKGSREPHDPQPAARYRRPPDP